MKNRLSVLLLLGLAASSTAFAAGVNFEYVFAPQDGLVNRYEKPLRDELCLNGSWQFQGTPDISVPGETPPPLGTWDKVAIKIPSPWNVNGFAMQNGMPGGDFRTFPSYPKQWETMPAAWMLRTCSVPESWDGHRVVLHFGAVAGRLVVYVNGRRAGEGFDIFFAQDFDVTQFIHFGEDNQILVKVIGAKAFDQTGKYGRREYLSGSFWGTFINGIWQDVFLLSEPRVAVSGIFVQPLVSQDKLSVELTVTNGSATPQTVEVSGQVCEWINQAPRSVLGAPEVRWMLADRPSLEFSNQSVALLPYAIQTVRLTAPVHGRLKTWSPSAPNLNGLLVRLTANGQRLDTKYQRFGWREFTMYGNQFLLNGLPIVLRGDSWHFMGVPQMSRRYAYAWFRLLKDAGANAVRLHASVYPSFYHDMADEMGIMVLDESPIWLSDGGPKADSELFWSNCRTQVCELVRRDRNHPSVFGWSVCNEILPVLRNVWHAPPSMVDHCLDEIAVWKNICLTNDPTRTWISGDGEWDAEGRLPTINIHYGGDGELQRASQSGKPFAVGETSMAYYGTPKQVSKFNGDRAYESDLGRMEGLAYECYSLLTSQQNAGANCQSVFNIVWYGIQPLPLGKSDLTKAPSLEEGIHFGKFQEGIPGMQPERLGPYVTTLNPGYDPALPLYRPWPMFEAIRDANLKKKNSPWASRPNISIQAVEPSSRTNVSVSYLPENGSRLVKELGKAGLVASAYKEDVLSEFLLLDASEVLTDAAKRAVTKTLAQDGTIWVWDIRPLGAASLSELLGEELVAEPRVGSSFIIKKTDPLIIGLGNADLYFSEDDDWRQMSHSLSGKFIADAHVIVEACPADWRRWNYKGEQIKTSALFRSEHEDLSARAVIAVRSLAHGRVILCNLSSEIKSTKKLAVIRRLFRNESISMSEGVTSNDFTDLSGRLVRALICGSFALTNGKSAYGIPFPADQIKPGAELYGHQWHAGDAGRGGIFDFKNGLVGGVQENCYAYLAVWIKSPKPLNDLLSEPNLPKLSFVYGSDDGCQVWLNSDLLSFHDRHGPISPDMFSENPLLLKLGWNQLVIKVVQSGGEWKFAGKFNCNDQTFLSKVEFALEKPATP